MYAYFDILNKFNKSSIPDKLSFKLANNTYVTRLYGSKLEDIPEFTIILHNSAIASVKPDQIILNACGFRTNTTKDRMNSVLSDNNTTFRIYQENHQWFIYNYQDRDSKYPYADQVTFIHELNCKIGNGWEIYNYGLDRDQELKQLKNKISKYVNKYYELFKSGELGIPSNGDCFGCQFSFDDNDHLLAHLDESYYVPSLLVLATKQRPGDLSIFINNCLYLWFNDNKEYLEYVKIIGDQIKHCLYKFMVDKLITNSS